jgi:hypothetical protein
MVDKEKPDEYRMVNVQLGEDVREMLGILKRRYNMAKMSDALKEFLKEKDPELVQVGEMLIKVQQRAADEG